MDDYLIDLDVLDADIARRYRNLATRLSKAQFSTLELWARGMKTAEIAKARGVVETTVENTKRSIRAALTGEEGEDGYVIALAAYWNWKYHGRA